MSSVALSSRQRWFGGLALAVLLAHALLLFALLPAWFDRDDAVHSPSVSSPVLSVRTVAAPIAAAAAPAAPSPRAPVSEPAKPAPPATPRRATAPAPATSSAPTPPPAPIEVAHTPSPDGPLASAPEVSEASASAVTELPVYATRLPLAGAWRYALQRGLVRGEAVLSWQPTEQGRYTLRLEGRVAGLTVLDWVSQGALDGTGIAPERFAIRRRGRDTQVANFQRDVGKITFSGPTHEWPLLAGVQDRVSWMLQLAAVMEASPALRAPGARVTLMVVGARGAAALWRFSVAGPERVGDALALKLMHEADRSRDSQVEVWLDPAQGYLPLRAVVTPPEGGAPLELRLQPREDAGSTGS